MATLLSVLLPWLGYSPRIGGRLDPVGPTLEANLRDALGPTSDLAAAAGTVGTVVVGCRVDGNAAGFVRAAAPSPFLKGGSR